MPWHRQVSGWRWRPCRWARPSSLPFFGRRRSPSGVAGGGASCSVRVRIFTFIFTFAKLFSLVRGTGVSHVSGFLNRFFVQVSPRLIWQYLDTLGVHVSRWAVTTAGGAGRTSHSELVVVASALEVRPGRAEAAPTAGLFELDAAFGPQRAQTAPDGLGVHYHRRRDGADAREGDVLVVRPTSQVHQDLVLVVGQAVTLGEGPVEVVGDPEPAPARRLRFAMTRSASVVERVGPDLTLAVDPVWLCGWKGSTSSAR